MSSQNKFSATCSTHCAPLEFLPASPCPELLLTNSVPSDVQLTEIHSFIRSVKAKITVLDDQIVQAQRTLDRLDSQRTELADLVESHCSIVSTIRRLPRDILSEIFSQYLDASNMRFYGHSPKAVSHLVGVCARWRAIALASPLLWRHIRPITREGTSHELMKLQEISLQLQRSASVALSIHLDETASFRVVDLLLTESRRWRSLCLTQWDDSYYKHLTISKVEFPVLEKLTLVIGHSAPLKDIALFVEPLPAIVDLTLHVNRRRIPSSLDITWAQLRICRLTKCCMADFLPILALFSAGTRVCLEDFFKGKKQLTSVQTVVSDLSLRCNDDEAMYNLLGALTAPCLERFRIVGCLSIPPIAAFFDRSLCALTHLGINPWSDFSDHLSDLLTLLRSPHASNIVDLDVDLLRKFDTEKLMDALACGIVPSLRTLALRHLGGSHGAVASVLKMHANRRPIFQSLWLNRFGRYSQDTLQALKSGGLEVVIFD